MPAHEDSDEFVTANEIVRQSLDAGTARIHRYPERRRPGSWHRVRGSLALALLVSLRIVVPVWAQGRNDAPAGREPASRSDVAGNPAEVDRRFIDELEAVRCDPTWRMSDAAVANNRNLDAGFVAAFRRAGLDIEAAAPDEIGKWVAQRPEAVEIASNLDQWVATLWIKGNYSDSARETLKRLHRAARAADWTHGVMRSDRASATNMSSRPFSARAMTRRASTINRPRARFCSRDGSCRRSTIRFGPRRVLLRARVRHPDDGLVAIEIALRAGADFPEEANLASAPGRRDGAPPQACSRLSALEWFRPRGAGRHPLEVEEERRGHRRLSRGDPHPSRSGGRSDPPRGYPRGTGTTQSSTRCPPAGYPISSQRPRGPSISRYRADRSRPIRRRCGRVEGGGSFVSPRRLVPCLARGGPLVARRSTRSDRRLGRGDSAYAAAGDVLSRPGRILKKLEDRVTGLRETIRIEPGDAEAHFLVGRLLILQSDVLPRRSDDVDGG